MKNPHTFRIAVDKVNGVYFTARGVSKRQFHKMVGEYNRRGYHFTYAVSPATKNRFRSHEIP